MILHFLMLIYFDASKFVSHYERLFHWSFRQSLKIAVILYFDTLPLSQLWKKFFEKILIFVQHQFCENAKSSISNFFFLEYFVLSFAIHFFLHFNFVKDHQIRSFIVLIFKNASHRRFRLVNYMVVISKHYHVRKWRNFLKIFWI